MHLVIRPEQQQVFEEQMQRVFAGEVASTLTPIIASLPTAAVGSTVTEEFAFEQLKRAESHGLKQKNEIMAWTLCASIHGSGFEQKMPQVRRIIADRHYDRSVLLTQLALDGMKHDPSP